MAVPLRGLKICAIPLYTELMSIAALLTALVAILHGGFLILEMFLWRKPLGLKIFAMTPEAAAKTAVVAMNQGFYNGILAAGLIWTFFIADPVWQEAIRTFFLSAVIGAGLFGALTAKWTILFVQALPAFLALLALKWNG